MADKKDKKKVRHCKCGKFAMAGSDQCYSCDRLAFLEIQLKNLQECKIQNRELKTEVTDQKTRIEKLTAKKAHPVLLTIHEKTWHVNEEYLTSFLKVIAPVADALKITWRRK